MRYRALACDYDGTLATQGEVDPATLEFLGEIRASGRLLILVTGRDLRDLTRAFPHLERFDRVVAENGALLYDPASKQERVLAKPPPEQFVEALRAKGVSPLTTGRVIVATNRPNESRVLETVQELGLELHLIFNRDSVMILPSGVNKSIGLKATLDELGLSLHNVVGVGDAENDHAFLEMCECSAAVANAIPAVREKVDFVTAGGFGAGVRDLGVRLLETDLAELDPRLARHYLVLGRRGADGEILISPYGERLLVCGPSGSGKSTFVHGLLERLTDRDYQFVVVDPEGDYGNLEEAVVLGGQKQAPEIAQMTNLVEKHRRNCVLNLLAVPLEKRPEFFAALLPELLEIRRRTARPHWIVLDEAHHLLPAQLTGQTVAEGLYNVVLITLKPGQLPPAMLSPVTTVVATMDDAEETLAAAAKALGRKPPAATWKPPFAVPLKTKQIGEATGGKPEAGSMLYWPIRADEPTLFRMIPPEAERRRHLRKYVEGELSVDESFYFRGPEGKLNLRAQNLSVFLQIAQGVDDETWLHHLRLRHYSEWVRDAIKDEALAGEIETVERDGKITAAESRSLVRAAIERRYVAGG